MAAVEGGSAGVGGQTTRHRDSAATAASGRSHALAVPRCGDSQPEDAGAPYAEAAPAAGYAPPYAGAAAGSAVATWEASHGIEKDMVGLSECWALEAQLRHPRQATRPIVQRASRSLTASRCGRGRIAVASRCGGVCPTKHVRRRSVCNRGGASHKSAHTRSQAEAEQAERRACCSLPRGSHPTEPDRQRRLRHGQRTS